MLEYNFDHIHLSLKSVFLLLKSRKCEQKYSPEYDSLIKIGMLSFTEFTVDEIGQQIPLRTHCKITEKGICYLRYRGKDLIDHKLPILLSILALIISILR